jgi:hypothetical protein
MPFRIGAATEDCGVYSLYVFVKIHLGRQNACLSLELQCPPLSSMSEDTQSDLESRTIKQVSSSERW